MLNGLLLRQAFITADVALITGLGVVFALGIGEFRASPEDPGPVSAERKGSASSRVTLAQPRDRAAYDVILNRGLFGQAGRFDPAPKNVAKPAPAPEVAQETKLPLTLYATVVSKRDDPLATAIIEVRQGRTRTETFYINEEILDGVFLKEVLKAEVILENHHTNSLENLKLSQSTSRSGATPTARVVSAQANRAVATRSTRGLVTLERAVIVKRLEDTYSRLASTLNVRVVKDNSGRVQGITTDNIDSIDVAQNLGFKNGDVLTSINNELIDSRDKAAQILRRYQNASIFRIGIIRDGQPVYINYRLR